MPEAHRFWNLLGHGIFGGFRDIMARGEGQDVRARLHRVRYVSLNHHVSSFNLHSPYRAPETIFGPTHYNPFAIDLWSAGALCAEFFTCIRFVDDEDEDEQEDRDHSSPFVFPDDFTLRRGYWSRDALFDAERGSIGLAWSIFKTRGSPNEENWPVRLLYLLTLPCSERSFAGL